MIAVTKNQKRNIVLSLLGFLLLSGCTSGKNRTTEGDVSRLADKTIVFFGDSITQNFEVEEASYPDLVGSLTKAETINMGLGGTSMSVHPNKSFDTYAFHSLVDAIISSDFSAQQEALGDSVIPGYFAEKLDKLEAMDWNEVDIITVMYGSNDWGKPIDNKDDLMDINTFKGAGRSSLEKLLNHFPHLELLFIPTIYRFWPDYNDVDTDTSVNGLGIRPYEYSDAMTALAKEFKFPHADTLYGLGINKYNRHLYFSRIDGTHPNKLGTEKIGQKVAKTLLYNY